MISKNVDQLRDWLFRQVHSKNLVYNTCWEDPRCDRQLMQLDAKSKIVMITSAGCNALDYLLDDPAEVNCIDVNKRQNALLHLKQSLFKNGNYELLYQLFGEGRYAEAEELYESSLRPLLPDVSKKYWDKNIKFFKPKGLRKSFYHHGTSGALAWVASRYFRSKKKLYKTLIDLFEAKDLESQKKAYVKIEEKLMKPAIEWIVNRHLTMCLIGVPRSQQLLFVENYDQGALGFIQECLRKVFTEIPVHDNYFWRLYITGKYEKDCCPSYLEEKNFKALQSRVDRIKTHTTTISQFLKDNPGTYSHYVLLDHQDWLAENDIPALEEEWSLILQNSKPGTKILLRSAAETVDFFPDFVLEKLEFEKELTVKTHKEDRVGTYASVYLGIVK